MVASMDQELTTATTPVALAAPTEQAVRRALADHGRLAVDAMDVASIADLYALGLTSHATVNVMLAVENELDVEFPDELLHRSTFATVESIAAAAGAAS
jgi:acyl carrier protein